MDFARNLCRLPLALDAARGAAARALLPPLPDATAALIEAAAGSSPFLAGLVEREASWLPGGLALADPVRRAKRRLALLIALGDLGGAWPLERVTGTLTAFADRATDLAFRAHLAAEIRRGRLPANTAGEAGGLLLLAMGKMGAGELN